MSDFDASEPGGSGLGSELNFTIVVSEPMNVSGGGGDTTPPVVSNFSPPVGNTIAFDQVVTFDVTDNTGFSLIILHASFSGFSGVEVIHDGTNFNQRYYTGGANTRTVIANGFRYTILRDTGWPATFTLHPYAIDTSGNENP